MRQSQGLFVRKGLKPSIETEDLKSACRVVGDGETIRMLGKPEEIKLRATHLNNLSAGLILGGLLIPYLAFVQHAGTVVGRLVDGPPLTFTEIGNAAASVVAMAMALYSGKQLRRKAFQLIATLDENPKADAHHASSTDKEPGCQG